ncbi:hypothetical protein [Actinomadura luteofluorescens]
MVFGLLFAEWTDIAPWAADKIVRRAAHRKYSHDPGRAEHRAEEWAALIEDRPGKLLKLGTALTFSVGTMATQCWRRTRSSQQLVYRKTHSILRLAIFLLAPGSYLASFGGVNVGNPMTARKISANILLTQALLVVILTSITPIVLMSFATRKIRRYLRRAPRG